MTIIDLNNKTRNEIIDLMKALGIIFMVMGHSGAPFVREIYLFHMPLFFMISGYCLKEIYSDSMKNIFTFIKKKIMSLYIPCLCMCISCSILHNIFISIYLLNDKKWKLNDFIISFLKCFLFSGGSEFSGTAWFLRTLFLSSIIYILVEFILKKIDVGHIEMIKTVLFLIILIVVYLIPNNCIVYNYLNSFSALILLQMGHVIKKVPLQHWMIIPSIICLLVMKNLRVNIDFSKNIICNPIVFIMCAMSGFIMCYIGAEIITKFEFIKKYMEYLGKHTMIIMILHFISFKIVILLQIIIYHYPMEKLQTFPCLITSNLWWCVYTVFGVIAPLVVGVCIEKIKQRVKKCNRI